MFLKKENKLINIRCPLCQTKIDPKNKARGQYLCPINTEVYSLYRCANNKCDLMFWEPRKAMLQFYETECIPGYKEMHNNIYMRPSFYEFIKNVPIKSGRLIDVGCGGGSFLKLAEENGYEAYGIDIDPKSIEMCKKYGVNKVFNSSIEEYALTLAKTNGAPFDVVSFFEVIEHLENIQIFFENIKKILKPGGYVAFSCPNRNSIINLSIRFLLKIFSPGDIHKFAQGDLPPHHFTWWSEKSISHLLTLNGFKDIEVFPLKLKFYDRAIFWRDSAKKIIFYLFKREVQLPLCVFYPFAIISAGFLFCLYAQAKYCPN